MLNGLWAGMLLLGVVYGLCTGNAQAVTDAAIDSAGDAISLCITMGGAMSLWMGLMEIATVSGLIGKMTKGIGPFLHFLFPKIPKGHPALGYIATNMIANVMGLGWACTPAGIKAMEQLAVLEEERASFAGAKTGIASDEMCTFLILNISSLQLIPVNMIAYRNQFHSAEPSAVILPAIIATSISTITGLFYCKGHEIISECKRKDL